MERGARRTGGRLGKAARGTRRFPTAVLCAAVGLLSAFPGGAAGLSVEPAGPRSLTAEPRGVLTLGVRVENGSSEALELLARIVLPAGWRRLGSDTGFSLKAGEADTRLLSFLVPQGARPGLYEIPVSVERTDSAGEKAGVTFTVVVSPRWKVEVQLLSSPDLAMAGDEYRTVFSVRNAGNADAVILLDVFTGGGFPFRVDADRLELGSGGSSTVTVTVRTPQRLETQVTSVVVLKARVEQEESASAEATGSLVAIPGAPSAADAYWSLPVTASLSSGYRSSAAGALWGIRPVLSSDGFLDEEGRNRISLLLRPAAFPDPSSIADADEYRVGLRSDAFSFVLGDAERTLSPLLAPSLWGRGVEARAGLPFLEAAGFFLQPPGGDSTVARTGARLTAVLPNDGRAGIQWLRAPSGEAASALVRLAGPVKLQAEYGIAAGSDGGTVPDSAVLVDLVSARPGPSWSLMYLQAGPRFPGAYRDLEAYSAGANIPIRAGLTATASLRQERHNLEKAAARGAAPEEAIASIGLDGSLGSGISMSFGWRSQQRRDLLPESGFDSRSDTVHLDLGRTLHGSSVAVGAQLSRTDDLRSAKTLLEEKVSASVEIVPGNGRTIKGTLAYDVSGDMAGARPSTVTATVSASLKPTAASTLTAQIQWVENPLAFRSGSMVGKAEFHHVFPGREAVSAQAGITVHADPRLGNEMFLQADFRIPLSVPIARRKTIGTVLGTVSDSETGAPVAGALLRIESFTAVSDLTGAFRFPALKPGSYYLSLDTGRLGYERISTRPLPMQVTVGNAGETRVQIGITRKASLSGTVSIQGAGGLGRAMVELSNGEERKRTYTDAAGRFSFPELRPGAWVLALPAGEIPEYSDMESNNVALDLSPGQEANAVLTVIPRKRTIRMIEEGTVEEEESKP